MVRVPPINDVRKITVEGTAEYSDRVIFCHLLSYRVLGKKTRPVGSLQIVG